MTLPNTKDYLNSIISNLGVIEAFSYIDEARTRETLEKVDTVLDTLRDYLEGREGLIAELRSGYARLQGHGPMGGIHGVPTAIEALGVGGGTPGRGYPTQYQTEATARAQLTHP